MLIQIKRILTMVLPLMLLIGILYSIVTFIRGDWRLSYDDVQITKLLVCSEPDMVVNKSEGGLPIISSNSTYIFACGHLNANFPVRLHFYLYKEPNSRPIDNSRSGEEYSEGFFNQQLYLPTRERQGQYRIDVYLFRDVIASTTFKVADP